MPENLDMTKKWESSFIRSHRIVQNLTPIQTPAVPQSKTPAYSGQAGAAGGRREILCCAKGGSPCPGCRRQKSPHGKPDGRHGGLFACFAGMIR